MTHGGLTSMGVGVRSKMGIGRKPIRLFKIQYVAKCPFQKFNIEFWSNQMSTAIM
jgi:hypothetical protein